LCGDDLDALYDWRSCLRATRDASPPEAWGNYVFYEHGRSPDPRVAKLQDRVNPLWRLTGIGCGCTINRPIDSLISQAGFRIISLERYVLGRPQIMLEMYRGVATYDAVAGSE